MRDSNRISLDDLGLMPIGDIAALAAEQLALLQEEAGERLRAAEAVSEWLNGAIALKYTDRAAMARLEAAKDTGTVRLADEDGVVVAVTTPKRVDWDQHILAALVEKIRAAGEDPAEYVRTKFDITERAYAAWPSHIRKIFEPARTVRTGKMTFRLIRAGEE
ncbi:hypothetical protein [Rhizobium sp. Root482]|uniref:hypothetical protein n=1 Tax=Rhizobium sp. Root482 TaxID=1736543 RepID=UPI0006F8F651|nr:hypothetical protein [Rhizobium sp. Root482]KQY13203.1 hypothetical protein ASD31_13525 [Rhizobium sp. Root482]